MVFGLGFLKEMGGSIMHTYPKGPPIQQEQGFWDAHAFRPEASVAFGVFV